MARKFRRYLFPLAFLSCATLSWAQAPAPSLRSMSPRNFDASYLGDRVMLGPDWLLSPDDNPAYASPDYDDSGWKTISTDQSTLTNGIRDIPYLWYRSHVQVPRSARFLAIETQFIEGSYELYVNGKRIGTNGNMNGMPEAFQDYLTSYEVPDSLISSGGDLTIAIRIAVNKRGRKGVGLSTPLQENSIFVSSRDAAGRDESYEASHQTEISLMLSGLALVVGLVALALYLAMRSQLEYLAIAISLLASGLNAAVIVWEHLHLLTFQTDLLETLTNSVTNVALIEFVRLILNMRRTRWLLALEAAVFLGYFSPNLAAVGLLSTIPNFVGNFLPSLVVLPVLSVLMLRGMRRGNRDARVVFPAIAVICVANYWNVIFWASKSWPLPFNIPPMPTLHFGTYVMEFWDIWNVIYGVTMLLFLVLRTIGIARGTRPSRR